MTLHTGLWPRRHTFFVPVGSTAAVDRLRAAAVRIRTDDDDRLSRTRQSFSNAFPGSSRAVRSTVTRSVVHGTDTRF